MLKQICEISWKKTYGNNYWLNYELGTYTLLICQGQGNK